MLSFCRIHICLVVAILFIGGCSPLRSRYAMDDPVYEEKYSIGAEKDDLLGKVKQGLDARHTEGLSGVYLSAGVQGKTESNSSFVGGDIGIESYFANYLTGRAALVGYGGEEFYTGVDLGFRFQTPTRLAPFAGLGTFHGYGTVEELAHADGVDNDGDGFTDELGEVRDGIDRWISAVYPETGVHIWCNGNLRLSAYGRYLVTTEGRDSDGWLAGLQLAFFRR